MYYNLIATSSHVICSITRKWSIDDEDFSYCPLGEFPIFWLFFNFSTSYVETCNRTLTKVYCFINFLTSSSSDTMVFALFVLKNVLFKWTKISFFERWEIREMLLLRGAFDNAQTGSIFFYVGHKQFSVRGVFSQKKIISTGFSTRAIKMF